MKGEKSNYWTYAIVFLLGALISYILCQFKLLEIDPKVNITETILSVITALVGLYIAVSLQRRQNQSQNLYSNIEKKFDSLWGLFSQFASQLELSVNMPLNEVNKSTKEFNQKIATLKIMLSAFNLNTDCIKDIESKIDKLENELTSNSQISTNILDYTSNKAAVHSAIEQTHQAFANYFKELNKMV